MSEMTAEQQEGLNIIEEWVHKLKTMTVEEQAVESIGTLLKLFTLIDRGRLKSNITSAMMMYVTVGLGTYESGVRVLKEDKRI